jgi:hypothetical protein
MKLSELQHCINAIRFACDDPNMEFEVNGSKAELTSMTLTVGPCDFSIERGDLREMPKPAESLVVKLEVTDG